LTFELTQQEGELLVKLARRSATEYLQTKGHITVPEDISHKLLQPCGVFVTINSIGKHGAELRGCIGLPYPTTPLAQAVIEAAVSSATEDPRFESMKAKELDRVVFEVSVLTPPEIVETKKATDYSAKIKVGKHGLIVERGMNKGLLLPQVPVEWKWDEQEFLCQCSMKAGLPPDCWLINGTRIYKFEAIIFEEETPNGKIIRKLLCEK
jgi:uncharacterized protein (TIGR00296 family)